MSHYIFALYTETITQVSKEKLKLEITLPVLPNFYIINP